MRTQDFGPLPERITFTVDVEDHVGTAGDRPRYVAMTRRVLDFLAERQAVGTFFIVGDIAERTPGLVREIAARGHEIASHSHRHVTLPGRRDAGFAEALAGSRRRLEDLADAPVQGFRAPQFSLVPTSAWALDALAEAGFTYSSSIVPGKGIGCGWPGAPSEPFLWRNGLLELPCPVGKVAVFRLPFLGGMYLRYLPPWRLRQASRSRSTDVMWTYCHPYDFDTEEPFRRLPGRSVASSFFLWWNRGLTLHRLDVILRGRRTAAFRDLLAELSAAARPFDPPIAGAAA